MRRIVGAFCALSLLCVSSSAQAEPDPIGDLIAKTVTALTPAIPDFMLKATLYHAGAAGVGALDSLGCKPVAMRTVAIDKTLIPRRTVLFIEETVGLPMPDGSTHDGYWYASDVGGAVKGERIDLYTGEGRGSMKPLMGLNLKRLGAVKAGTFKGCPPG